MNDNWGLTERGFLRPSYADLLDAFEVKAKELFGSTVNLSVRSPLGIFLRIFAWFAGLTWYFHSHHVQIQGTKKAYH